MSEVVFFGGLFSAYATLRASAEGPWPPPDVELETGWAAVATVVLLSSSATVQVAARAAEEMQMAKFRRWLLITVALGALFLANQAREWSVATFSADSHPFGSAFFVITGFHGAHVLAGLIAMLVMASLSSRRGWATRGGGPAEVLALYWHVVDGVWVVVFTVLFLLR